MSLGSGHYTTNPDVILHGLMRRYGTETKLRELNKLRKPSTADLVHATHNMTVLKRNIMFIRDLNQTRRLEASVISDIVNTAMDKGTLKKYNVEFMKFRTKHFAEAAKACPGIIADNFGNYFNSGNLLDDRLDFLIGFLDQALEYNRLLHHGRTKPPETGRLTQPPSLPLTDRWVCRLCGTSHPDPKTDKGRKWYLDICSAFMQLTQEDKLKFVKKEQLGGKLDPSHRPASDLCPLRFGRRSPSREEPSAC